MLLPSSQASVYHAKEDFSTPGETTGPSRSFRWGRHYATLHSGFCSLFLNKCKPCLTFCFLYRTIGKVLLTSASNLFQVMYRNIFSAWYCLGVLALCLASFLILLPFIGPERAMCSFAFTGLFGFLPFFWFFIFRNTKEDERDVSFRQRAVSIGFACGWATIYFLSGLVHFIYYGGLDSDSIPINVFWLPANCGMIIFGVVASVTLLLLYYKGERVVEG